MQTLKKSNVLLRQLLKKVPILNVLYTLTGGNFVLFGPILALLGSFYLALEREKTLLCLTLIFSGLLITLIGINQQLNKRGQQMFKLFHREAKSPFEELKDVFRAIGKGFDLRNALLDKFQLGDIDEIIAFVSALPEAIVGAKNIDPETLTEEQKAELVQIVVDEWKVPDSEKVSEALPFLIDGVLSLSQGIDMIA